MATLPDTNGTVVTFQSGGDVWYENVDSSGSHQIVFTDVTGSIEGNPNISGDVITFERSLVSGGPKDLYAYKIGTNSLFQLTDTPDVNEKLNDVSIDLDGRFRVVWSQPEVPGTISPNDVWFAEFEIAADAPIYTTQTMFDQSRSYKLGSVVPIRLQLLDANGANVSSPSVTPTATALVHKDNTASATVTDAGNSNPDNAFRYDAALGGYAFNLSTKNLSAGTWELQFTATGDTHVYSITFSLR